MFKIGDFSKLSQVPVKTLRYYDEIGLLKPSGINHFTRYRYYSEDQLPLLHRILDFKELGFSLEQIAHLLEGNLSPEQVKKMLVLRRSEIEQQVNAARSQLELIDARIRQIDEEVHLPFYNVQIKQLAPLWVASIRSTIAGYEHSGPVFGELFNEVANFAARHRAFAGPGLALYYDSEPGSEQVEFEAAMPVQRRLNGYGRISVVELPAVEKAACTVHQGSFAAIASAYQALLSWIDANHYQIDGPVREVYLKFTPTGDPSQNLTEIQVPVRTKPKDQTSMEPKIVTLDQFMVIGMPYLGKNEHQEIGQMWNQFIPRIMEVPHKGSERVSYGLCMPNDKGLIDYVAGVPVTDLSSIPEGMVGKMVPAMTYAVFEAHGLVEIPTVYDAIAKDWLPNSGYEYCEAPDFELYPPTFRGPNDTLQIYFPVKKK